MIQALLNSPNFPPLLAAGSVILLILTLAYPFLAGDKLSERMRYVSKEREEMRKKARAQMASFAKKGGGLRHERPKTYMEKVVLKLNLRKHLEDATAKDKLLKAGLRGEKPMITFLFMRFVMPFLMFAGALFYMFAIDSFGLEGINMVIAAFALAFLGFYLPNLWLSNAISKRQLSIRRSWPDAMDLMLICVESGMSIEHAMRKVAEEIGVQSVELAEEMSLTVAELSYLTERRQAYENLTKRTGLEGIKSVCTALIQSERYGTPIGQALRVLAQENRDTRMSMAEKKAAALPPKLTVPMIMFFLPPLFIIILGPAYIQVKMTGAI